VTKRLKVLIAEDEFVLADDLARYFASKGADIIGFAPTVRLARQIIKKGQPFDVAVLDISLADAEVYEVADLVRNRGACLVFYTATDARQLPERFRDAPIVNKPASGEQIYSAVLRACAPTAE
jgi:DNA-binding LytR/AlgR family response regulator